MSKILVTGATGHFGNATINFLLKKGVAAEAVSALVRDEVKAAELKSKGVALKIADYDDYEALLTAFSDIETLLFVSGSDLASRVSQHENVVKAAKEVGIKHVIYTSFQRKNETKTSPIAVLGEAHIKTEKWLKESGLTYTILRNNLYTEYIPVFIGEKVLEAGQIYLPGGDGKCAYVLRDDMAEATANILSSTGHEGKIYNFTGNTAYSYQDIANILSEVTGKNIRYVSPSVEEFTKSLTEAGVPEEYIGMFAGFSAAKAQGEFAVADATMERLLGRKPTSVSEYLKQIYS